MKKSLSSVLCLTIISLVITGLLAVTNSFTDPIIKKAESAAAFASLTEVLPDGEFAGDCEVTDISDDLKKIGVEAAYKSSNGGCVVTIVTAGYSTGLKLMFGVDKDGKIAGSKCLASGETLGEEKTYGSNILGMDINNIDGVSTVAGATKTTTAYRNAAKSAMQAAVILAGGTVDTRTEEEILNDTLNEVLGTTGAAFTPWFKTAALGTIGKVYIAEGQGYVFEVGDKYAAVDTNGALIKNDTDLSADDFTNAYKAVTTETLTDVDFAGLELSEKVTAVQKSASGSYILFVNGSGFGINGDAEYGISGKHIEIKVSVTGDGTILDCITVAQYETNGIGSACAEPSYYSQYAGKDLDTLNTVQAISGATITSRGYSVAVKAAVESAIKLQEAGK